MADTDTTKDDKSSAPRTSDTTQAAPDQVTATPQRRGGTAQHDVESLTSSGERKS